MPAWNGPEEPIQQQIRSAFNAQATIGWDQFFRARTAKAWRIPIARTTRSDSLATHNKKKFKDGCLIQIIEI
jgi:hypothetical protein